MLTKVLIYGAFLFFIVYAWKDWYRALCGLVILIGVIENPYMPKTMLGVPGLNLWNLLLISVVLAWLVNRRKESLVWDMPKKINILLGIYVAIMLVSFLRMSGEMGFSTHSVSDYLINTLKWIVPGLLLFHGCRSFSRFKWAMGAVLALYVILALQVIRWMPLDMIGSGDEFQKRAIRIFDSRIGFHRVNMSVMLAGAFWVCISMMVIYKQKSVRIMLWGICGIILLGQALTAGRTGYGAWAAVGLVFALFRWRSLLIFGPLLIIAIAVFIPAAVERMTEGFTEETVSQTGHGLNDGNFDEHGFDLYTVLSGRNLAWPYVIDKGMERPFIGYGRKAMYTTGVAGVLVERYNESFPHPHNAYLQWWLDNGIIGLIPLLWFYYLMCRYSLSLFTDSRNRIYIAAGGMVIGLLFVQLIASLGSQSFYPREGVVGLWAGLGLMLRVYVERQRILDSDSSSDSRPKTRAYKQKAKGQLIQHKLWGQDG